MEEKVVKLRGIQRRVAQKMAESHKIPRVTTIREVRMDRVLRARKEWIEAHDGKKVSVLAYILRGMCKGIEKYPVFSAHIVDEDIIYPGEIGISVAVSIGENLVTPVLRVRSGMPFSEIAGAFDELVRKARENRLKVADFSGGCITVSNSGALGGEIFTPLINYPESAILGVGKIQKKPVVDADGSIIACPMMYLCLTYDHRLINGAQAVGFLSVVDDFLQNPETIDCGAEA